MVQNRRLDPRTERGMRNFCRFFKKLRTPARQRQASRSARPVDDLAAIDVRWRAHVREHRGLRVRRGVVAADVLGLVRHDWPGLSAIGKVVAERRLGDGAESVDTR